MDEADLRQLATVVRAILHSLIPDPVEAERVDAEIADALALPEGQGKRALRAALSSHPAVRAWLREQGVSGDTTWRGLPPERTTTAATPGAEPGEAESYEYGQRSPGLLWPDDNDTVDEPSAAEYVAQRPDRRFFVAELEDHPTDQPLKRDEHYTIAFSVGAPPLSAIATSPFPDETLAATWKDVEELDLTVQFDSDDFEVLGDSIRPLRVPRTGPSRGKARFDIAPRHDGHCRLVASVHYRGNFVHQMEMTILVGGRGQAAVEVSARGRPPDSAAAIEPRDISILLEPAPSGGFTCTVMGSVRARTILPIKDTELAAAVNSARKAMMSVIQTHDAGALIFQTGIDIPGSARDSALRTLARAGARLFQQLFLHPGAGADARSIGEWLRDQATDPSCRLKVLVAADQAPLPWALLYLGEASDGSSLDWNYFLGMRHIVEQLPLQQSFYTRNNQIPSTPKLAVSINVNTFIDPSMGISLVAGHQKYWEDTAAAPLAFGYKPECRDLLVSG